MSVGEGPIYARLRRLASGALLVALATLAASAGNYLLSIVAAHRLTVADFGAWGAMVGALAILGTLGLAAQAVVAREASSARLDHRPEMFSVHKWFSRLWPLTLGLILIIWIPLSLALSVSPVVMGLALATVPVAVGTSVIIGKFQGEGQFGRLSWAIVHTGLWRVLFGLSALLLTGSLLGLAIGVFLGSLVGLGWCLALSRGLGAREAPSIPLAAYLTALQALALMFALSNIDVLLARILLSADASGAYAVGSLIAKVTFFLPSPILIVLYPHMVRRSDRLPVYLAAAATGLVGLAFTSLCLIAPNSVIRAIAGDELQDMGPDLWRFAVAGTLLALVQVALYARLAQFDSRVLVLLWTGLGALVAIILATPDPSVVSIINTVMGVALVLTLVGLWMDRRNTPVVALPIEFAE